MHVATERPGLSRSVKLILIAVGVLVVGGLAVWGGMSAVERIRETSSGQPQPPPPTDKIDNVPAPDNTITTDERTAAPSGSTPR